jgi:flagellar biosynthesis protein FlhB
MTKLKKESFFWTSYSDLMTSLFFVMLVLFILTIVILHQGMKATKAQIDKINEIEEAVNKIDSTYFEYNKVYKKHILKIMVNFPIGVSDINVIDSHTQNELIEAGRSIQSTLEKISREYPKYNICSLLKDKHQKIITVVITN